MNIVQIGKSGINVEAVKDLSEKDFKKQYANTFGKGIDAAWKKVAKEVKKLK